MQLALFTDYCPKITPQSGREPYQGTGEKGDPYFGDLARRNRKQVEVISALPAPAKFMTNGEDSADMARLVRRSIITYMEGDVYHVSDFQMAEIRKYLRGA